MTTAVIEERVDHLQKTVDELNEKVVVYHQEILTCVQKKKKKNSGDENEERGNWGSKVDFLLSCLGYAVGLGNVWRFPTMCYNNGGGAFFIPYCIMLAFVGIPIFFLELSLGQFSSSGPATCWKFARLFRGIGFGMFVVSALVAIYYNMIIGWSFYYLFASFTSELPWTKCQPEWSTPMCLTNLPTYNESYCMSQNFTAEANGTCYSTNGTLMALYNETLARNHSIKKILPTQEYLEYVALGKGYSSGIEDLGPVRWQLVLCYLLAWVFVALTLSKGVKSSGKVVYFTATFPYLILLILFIRGLMLPGYYEGIMFYLTPDFERLKDAKVWKDAAVQIFFSLSASWGGLIALSSYNKFKNDVFRDALIVSFGNCLTSLFAGFVVFSYLGFLSHELNVPIDEVVEKGPTLTFVVYPFAVTMLPISTLWSILFFFMLFTLGVDSQFVLVETCVTCIVDLFPKTRDYKMFVVMSIAFVFFLLGLTLTTNGGVYMLDLMDTYSGGWNVMVIAICECIAVVYVYGIRRFLQDIETMVGSKVCGIFPWVMWKYWWAFCWGFLTPLIVAFIMVFSWVDYQRLTGYPDWADALGWLMTLSVILAIFVPGFVLICTSTGTIGERFRKATTPTYDWGPALVKHRKLVAKYVPNFIIDPKGTSNGDIVHPDSVDIHLTKASGQLPESYINDSNPPYLNEKL